jgi:hypothetical protein
MAMNNTNSSVPRRLDKLDPLWIAMGVIGLLAVLCTICHTSIAIGIKLRRKYTIRKQEQSGSRQIQQQTGNGEPKIHLSVRLQEESHTEQRAERGSTTTPISEVQIEPDYDIVQHHADDMIIISCSNSNVDSGTLIANVEGLQNSQYAILQSVTDTSIDAEVNSRVEPHISPYAVSPVIPLPPQMTEEVSECKLAFSSIEYVNLKHAEKCWEQQRSWSASKSCSGEAST